MGAPTRPMLTTGRKVVSIPYRFHPNATATPYTCSPGGGYGSAEVKAVAFVDTGHYSVSLQNRHERVVGFSGMYHTTSAPATNTMVQMFNATSGPSNANSFSVQLVIDGVTAAPAYSTSNYVCGILSVEELA